MKLVSLFTGASELDLGFKNAGFEIVGASEFDKKMGETFEFNFPEVTLDRRSTIDVDSKEIPDVDGIIGGASCQSWSGVGRGIDDDRSELFLEYIRVLEDKKPKFFLAENVSVILSSKHRDAFNSFIKAFEKAGYIVSSKLVNANDYNVPEDSLRVFIVGYRKDLNKKFEFPVEHEYNPILNDAIGNLREEIPTKIGNKTNADGLKIANHEHLTSDYSTMYMYRNQVRSFNCPSFPIKAGDRHAPIHPEASKMELMSQNKRILLPGKEQEYRKLSVREGGRIQNFSNDYIFKYNKLSDGYKMVGNSVSVNLVHEIAKAIMNDLK